LHFPSVRFLNGTPDGISSYPRGYSRGMANSLPQNPRILIVGGVAGGMSAATRLRRLLEHAEITVIERSGHVSFANCGLPYHVGGVIEDRESLLLNTSESLGARFGLKVLTRHEAIKIDRENKQLVVRDLAQDEVVALDYDVLILSPGARPVVPPIPGIERALTLRDIEDTDKMIAAVANAKTAVVIGGGFIGIELAENLRHRDLAVTVVEAAPQVMTPLDAEMIAPVQDVLREHGVDLRLGTSVASIESDQVTLADGSTIPADIVVAAIGVRPDVSLAVSAGLELGPNGGIAINENLATSDESIYAVGDAVEKSDPAGASRLVPLAGPANRQGRLVADVIAGRKISERPVQGTAILGVFGLQVATTGSNERTLRAAGVPMRIIHTHPANHAGYYPGAEQLSLKLIVDPATDEILGAQAVGAEGADKRIDVIATAMRGGLKASELVDLDLAYAPQFGSAKDPVNMLGYLDSNLTEGLVETIQWHELDDSRPIVDVRTPAENARDSIPGAINVELDGLREHLDQIPAGAVVYCQVGLRGYLAARLLSQHGIKVVNLDGGMRTWRAGQSSKAAPALVG